MIAPAPTPPPYTTHPSPTRAEVREALIHFIELAVAFEGDGIEIVPLDDPEATTEDPDAYACLSEVVARLRRRLQEQRERQRRAMLVKFHREATSLFERLKEDPDSVDLDAEAAAIVGGAGFEVDEAALTALVVSRSDLELFGGPSKTAAEAVGDMIDVTGRTIFKYASANVPLDLHRQAWRRSVPLGLCKRHVEKVVADALRLRQMAPTPTVSDLKEPPPALLAALDRRVEDIFRQNLDGMRRLMVFGGNPAEKLEPEQMERLRELEAFRTSTLQRVRDYVSEERGLPADDPAVVHEADACYERMMNSFIDAMLRGLGLDPA